MQTENKILSNLPNACTLLNATCGISAFIIALFYKTHDAINISCILITLGGFFDSIDGRLARKLNVNSEFGKQLDSFSDSITFGIAPICVFTSLHSYYHPNHLSIFEILIAVIYIVCTIYRLARYNVSKDNSHFVGLPSTASGILLSVYIFVSNNFLNLTEMVSFYSIMSFSIILILSILMVSNIRVHRI